MAGVRGVLRPPPDTEAIEMSAEEIARLRSLGYIN